MAGIAMAQQPDASASPAETKKGGGKPAAEAKHGRAQAEQAQDKAAQPQPGQNAPAQPATAPRNAKQQRGEKHAAQTEAGAPNPAEAGTPAATPGRGRKGHEQQGAPKSTSPAEKSLNPSPEAASSVTPTIAPRGQGRGKGAKAMPTPTATPAATAAATATPKPSATPSATVSATPSATATPATSATATPATSATAAAQTAPTATPGASVAASPLPTPKPNTAAATKKPAPQEVQQIKSQNATFRAQPRPQQVPAVTYNPQHRIEGADQWRAPQYEVFRSYRPERHDEGWYHSHYRRVELIGGGWYYWNDGYWYPAWGYRPHEEYYAYDGPIYVGRRAERADQVIADVQAELKHMGYYEGEVDGLVGPLTRKALREYQDDSGLYQTSVIDEPTLESLGLAS